MRSDSCGFQGGQDILGVLGDLGGKAFQIQSSPLGGSILTTRISEEIAVVEIYHHRHSGLGGPFGHPHDIILAAPAIGILRLDPHTETDGVDPGRLQDRIKSGVPFGILEGRAIDSGRIMLHIIFHLRSPADIRTPCERHFVHRRRIRFVFLIASGSTAADKQGGNRKCQCGQCSKT